MLRRHLRGCRLRKQGPVRDQWIRVPDACGGDLWEFLFDRPEGQPRPWNMQRVRGLQPGEYQLHRWLSLRGRIVHGSGRLYAHERLRHRQFLRVQHLHRKLRAASAGRLARALRVSQHRELNLKWRLSGTRHRARASYRQHIHAYRGPRGKPLVAEVEGAE